MHLLGSILAQSWEILKIRYSNTEYSGVQNVIINRRIVCLMTLYYKNYRSSDQVKIIHRYLPRKVGELVVWYL
ncbi:zinc knuckle [Cladorrhinum sp. PSN259]|nr:zinc knuckle [Cladorrhinum sp. PSN259]